MGGEAHRQKREWRAKHAYLYNGGGGGEANRLRKECSRGGGVCGWRCHNNTSGGRGSTRQARGVGWQVSKKTERRLGMEGILIDGGRGMR